MNTALTRQFTGERANEIAQSIIEEARAYHERGDWNDFFCGMFLGQLNIASSYLGADNTLTNRYRNEIHAMRHKKAGVA